MFDLTRKVALVTGSGRGLGFEIAQALAMAGATVLVNGRRSVQVTQAVEKIQAVGGTAESLIFNVADETARDTALTKIKRLHGRLDILVNNVGMRDRRTIDEVEATDFEALLQVNLTAVYALSRSAATFMRAQHAGRIINMSALASTVGLSHGPSYAASKGGLEALTRMLSVSLGEYGITVNAISPGYFATETNATMHADDALRHKLEGRTSLGRWGQPHEIAGAAVFLASDEASYITGQVLTVDGGCVSHF
ncbi:MAG: SDR family oxidoreductase [Arenicellales bacterium]|nr:SDR family oxidoreductase [Arenicellales bacterium]